MKDIPVSTLVHFEMASFTEEALLHELLDRIVPLADSLGMNEQELPNLLGMNSHDKYFRPILSWVLLKCFTNSHLS